jgi:cysteine-rich repeat protein
MTGCDFAAKKKSDVKLDLVYVLGTDVSGLEHIVSGNVNIEVKEAGAGTAPTGCGDNLKSGTEACDGTDFGSQTCTSLGFGAGNLVCLPDCSKIETSGCRQVACGDTFIDGTEECEGTNLNGKDCLTQGFEHGTLSCSATTCSFDLSQCYKCGDGVVNAGEECDDGINNGPDKACSATCTKTTCGDGIIQAPNGAGVNEQCDDGNPSNSNDAVCSNSCTINDYKWVFVTSGTWNGNLGGVVGADAKCNAAASAAVVPGLPPGTVLPGTYKALIGTQRGSTSMDGMDPCDVTHDGPSASFSKPNIPYMLVDGTIIANSFADLTTSKSGNYLRAPLNRDEQGNLVSSGNVWTNVYVYGTTRNSLYCEGISSCALYGSGVYGSCDPPSTLCSDIISCTAYCKTNDCTPFCFNSGNRKKFRPQFTCDGFTSGSSTYLAGYGSIGFVNTDWSTHSGYEACTAQNHLYCFRQ